MAGERFFRLKVERGDPIVAGDRQVVPVALVAGVGFSRPNRFGFGYGWARPLWLEVSDERGSRRVIVPDVTLLSLMILTMIGAFLYGISARERRPG